MEKKMGKNPQSRSSKTVLAIVSILAPLVMVSGHVASQTGSQSFQNFFGGTNRNEPILHRIAPARLDLAESDSKLMVSPLLSWKYAPDDGKEANSTGGNREQSRFPKPSKFLYSGYAPSDLSSAYGFDLIATKGSTNGSGAGRTIAIVDAYGSKNLQSDLDAFNAQYGLPSNTVTILYPDGKPSASDSGWAGETTMDVEWAHAMAPGASIIVVIASDESVTSMLKAVTYASTNADVVSMSWSTPEFAGQTQYDALFSTPGVTFVAASGDAGAGVNWPASSPHVLGVGGTTLTYNTNSGLVSEVAWNGSGGGVSSVEPLPTYQIGFNNNAGRGVPDVSYDADPYTGVSVFFTDPTSTNAGGWFVFGGTSVGTPQWAALVARRASLGNQGSNSFNSVLYANAGSRYSTILNDISQGSNGYPALPGYDLVTGLGSPIANQVAGLTDALPTPSATPSPTPKPTPRPTQTPVPIVFYHPTPFSTPKYNPVSSPSPHPWQGTGGYYPNQGKNWWSRILYWFGSANGIFGYR